MSNTAQCPVCGRTITKEQFLKNKICPNPMCATELDDEEELLEAFGLLQGNDDNNEEEPKEEEDLLSQLIKGSNRYHDTATKGQKKASNINNFLTGAPASTNNKHEEPTNNTASKPVSNTPETNSKPKAAEEPKKEEPEFIRTDIKENHVEPTEKSKDDVIADLLKKLEAYETGETSSRTQQPVEKETAAIEEPIVVPTVANNVPSSVDEVKAEENSLNIQPDAFRVSTDNKMNVEVSEEVPLPHVEKVTLEEDETEIIKEEPRVENNEPSIPEKELSSAEKLRMRLKGSVASSNEDIEKVVEDKYEKANREVESDEYNSNYDGYYDDAESDVPPVPDTINISTIRTVIIALLGIVGLSAFLIYYI